MPELIEDWIVIASYSDNVSHVSGLILRQVRMNLNLSIDKATAWWLLSVPAAQKIETWITHAWMNTFLKYCFLLWVHPSTVINVAIQIMNIDTCKVIMQQREKGKIPLEICREIGKRMSDIMVDLK